MGNQQALPSPYVHDQWLLDHECDNCAGCFQKFTLTKRRHHCRSCGEVFCAKCCNPKFITLPKKYDYEAPQRVCEVCHSFFSGQLQKLQVPRYVAIMRYLKNEKHEPGPPLLPANINRGQMYELKQEQEQHLLDAMDEAAGLCGSVGSKIGSLGASGGLLGTSPGTQINSHGKSRRGNSSSQQPAPKHYVDLCSIKLANWRPLGKTTRIHFCKTSSLVNEVAQSSRVFKRPAEWDMPTPLPSSDRSRVTNRSRTGAGGAGGADTSPNLGQSGDGQNRARLEQHKAEDENYKNAAWTLECGSILHLVLDHSIRDGVDYIYCETADEIFYVQSLQPKGAIDSQHISGMGMGGSVRPTETDEDEESSSKRVNHFGEKDDDRESEFDEDDERKRRRENINNLEDSDDNDDADNFPKLVDIDHYEHNPQGTLTLYEELKELHRLIQIRVIEREKMIEAGKMNPNRSDTEVISSGAGESAFLTSGMLGSGGDDSTRRFFPPPSASQPVLVAPRLSAVGAGGGSRGGGGTSPDQPSLPLAGSISPRPRRGVSNLSSTGSIQSERSQVGEHPIAAAGEGILSSAPGAGRPKGLSELPLAKLKMAQVRAQSTQGVGSGGEGDIGEPY